MQLLAYETIEHHALLSRDNACPKSHVLVNELSESFSSSHAKQYELRLVSKGFAAYTKMCGLLTRTIPLNKQTNLQTIRREMQKI